MKRKFKNLISIPFRYDWETENICLEAVKQEFQFLLGTIGRSETNEKGGFKKIISIPFRYDWEDPTGI